MPFGGSALGVAYFGAVKLAGYSAAGAFINRREELVAPHPVLFGLGRTLLGVAAGVAAATGIGLLFPDHGLLLFLLLLIPIRVLEWIAMLWIAYRPGSKPWERRWTYVEYGILWSFFLDLPAITAMIALPGGFWIC